MMTTSRSSQLVESRPVSISSRVRWSTGGAEHDSDIHLLNRVAKRMSSAAPLPDVLNDVVEFVTTVVKCDSCMIYVLEGETLVLRASKNPHLEVVDRLQMNLGQGITGWVAQHREPVVVSRGAYNDPRFQLFNELPEDRYEAFLSVPLVSGGRLVGVVNVQNRLEHSYSKREIGLIVTLGFLVGAEVERARLEGQNIQLLGQLQSRKIIERAKGILQRDLNLSEEDAYLTLQRESRQRRKSMKEVAEAVILSEDLMKKR
jgi:uroporphyrinogen-III synthase